MFILGTLYQESGLALRKGRRSAFMSELEREPHDRAVAFLAP
jgi:hypothetical protein